MRQPSTWPSTGLVGVMVVTVYSSKKPSPSGSWMSTTRSSACVASGSGAELTSAATSRPGGGRTPSTPNGHHDLLAEAVARRLFLQSGECEETFMAGALRAAAGLASAMNAP